MTRGPDPIDSTASHRLAALPQLVAQARSRTDIDATTILTFYIVVLIGLPSRYVFAPLGGVGTPALLLGVAALILWCTYRLLQPRWDPTVIQPVRRSMLIFVAAVVASYIVASTRVIAGNELSSADHGLFAVASWLGVLLLTTDGVTSRSRFDTLVRRLVMAAGALAALGVVQFLTHRPLTNYLQLPGLSENSELDSIAARAGFARPAGTALHPIEFAVVLSALLPLALHQALDAGDRSKWRWFPVIAIALAIPISVSRSAIVCTAVALAFVLPAWPVRRRRTGYVAIAGLFGFVFVAVPGMLGTILSLFTGISSDSSAQSRTDSYGIAFQFIGRAPILGRGFFTFLPAYRILDNEYLLTLIELGIVGLTALLVLFLTAVLSARRVRRRSTDPGTRHLAQCLAASIAAAASGFALFDALSFPMLACLVFLLIGLVGALYRIEGTGVPATATMDPTAAPLAGPPLGGVPPDGAPPRRLRKRVFIGKTTT